MASEAAAAAAAVVAHERDCRATWGELGVWPKRGGAPGSVRSLARGVIKGCGKTLLALDFALVSRYKPASKRAACVKTRARRRARMRVEYLCANACVRGTARRLADFRIKPALKSQRRARRLESASAIANRLDESSLEATCPGDLRGRLFMCALSMQPACLCSTNY